MAWVFFTLFITLLYVGLIAFYLFHWWRIRPLKERSLPAEMPFVSIVIVGRNEADNIHKVISSILENSYPYELFEIIYVDDHSEDDSLLQLSKFNNRNLSVLELRDYKALVSDNTQKKQAIDYALSKAGGNLIIHTDADTVVGENWIKAHVLSYIQGATFTAAPIVYYSNKGFLANFQHYDVITTMAVTGAGISSGIHYLANGANMSYERAGLDRIDETHGKNYASGDDVFLVQAFSRTGQDNIRFITDLDAQVFTFPEKGWEGFFRQRLRWAGKSMGYKDRGLLVVEGLVFVMNMVFLVNGFLVIFAGLDFSVFLLQFIIKLLTDFCFIWSAASKLRIKTELMYFFPSFLFYPIYYLIIGISAFLPIRISWKGRPIS